MYMCICTHNLYTYVYVRDLYVRVVFFRIFPTRFVPRQSSALDVFTDWSAVGFGTAALKKYTHAVVRESGRDDRISRGRNERS